MTKSIANFKGAVLGAAIGDALGFIIEKKPITEVERFVTTFKKDGTYSIPHRIHRDESYAFGQISDDTQFSRHLILSLIAKQGFNSQDYFSRILSAYQNKELVGIGGNTARLLKASVKNEDTSLLKNNTSNGSLMRSWPIGLFFSAEDEIMLYSEQQSALTHNTEEAISTCQQMALSINHLKDNSINSLRQYWESTNLLNLDFYFLDMNLSDAQAYCQALSPNKEWEFVSPSAKATMAAVMYAVWQNKDKSFQDAILTALSLGGDTDSVASLVGALIGFHHATHSQAWNDIVHDQGNFRQEYLINLSKELYHASK